jgi:hypothetical protein
VERALAASFGQEEISRDGLRHHDHHGIQQDSPMVINLMTLECMRMENAIRVRKWLETMAEAAKHCEPSLIFVKSALQRPSFVMEEVFS